MSSDQPDPYAVLGVSPGASLEELKRARRTLAKKWHPDRSWADTGTDKLQRDRQMKLINAAFVELSRRDPVREAARARAEQAEREREARERAARKATQDARERAAADAAARERSERRARERADEAARERAERERRERVQRERAERERAENERVRRERARADRDARQPSRFASEALSERTTFRPVGLVFPSGREGFTIRICVDGDDDDNVIFLARGRRFVLFDSPESMATFLTTDRNHDLNRLPGWNDIRLSMADSPPAADDYADFEFILQTLHAPSAAWVPEPFVVCRDLVFEIATAFGHRRLLETVGPGTPIDRLDDVLRAVDGPAPDWRSRRKLRRLDARQLGMHWRLAASRLRSIAYWHPGP
jgi:curved DNA-binding protein CbpA